jgi:DNA-3-methyladenine glycosylase II
MLRDSRPEVIDYLCRDKKLKLVIDQCEIQIHKEPISVFEDLLRSIVSQQLSISAAKTIYTRFQDLLGCSLVSSDQVLALTLDQLRSIGFSFQKASYVHNVAQFFKENDLHNTDWSVMSDDDIQNLLTEIKGVGKWTVEMILMFTLHREDVLPLDDLIIRNHIIALYGVETTNKKQLYRDLTNIAEAWRPYRSFACRYLWAGKGLDIFKV